MIRPLRRRHRAMWRGLALVLPLVAFAAWRAHRTPPPPEPFPAFLRKS